jgi:hypothetical protein
MARLVGSFGKPKREFSVKDFYEQKNREFDILFKNAPEPKACPEWFSKWCKENLEKRFKVKKDDFKN